jgi:hypothetical protein
MLYDLSLAGTRGLASTDNQNEEQPVENAMDNDQQA